MTSSYSFGPSVQWNIFDGWLRRNRIKESRAVADQTLVQYRQTVLTAFQEVENAWIAYDREIARAQSLEIAVARNRRAYELANQLYIEGESDFLPVLVVERSLYATETALAQSRNAAATNLVSLYKALGGGWEDLPAADPQESRAALKTEPPAPPAVQVEM